MNKISKKITGKKAYDQKESTERLHSGDKLPPQNQYYKVLNSLQHKNNQVNVNSDKASKKTTKPNNNNLPTIEEGQDFSTPLKRNTGTHITHFNANNVTSPQQQRSTLRTNEYVSPRAESLEELTPSPFQDIRESEVDEYGYDDQDITESKRNESTDEHKDLNLDRYYSATERKSHMNSWSPVIKFVEEIYTVVNKSQSQETVYYQSNDDKKDITKSISKNDRADLQNPEEEGYVEGEGTAQSLNVRNIKSATKKLNIDPAIAKPFKQIQNKQNVVHRSY